MFKMRRIVALLVFGALSVGAIDWDHMYVRWADDDSEHVKSFFDLPLTADAAAEAGYVEVPSVNKFRLTTYCLDGDHRVCPLYQRNGCVAGLQLAVLLSDVANVTSYDMSSKSTFSRGTMFGQDVWLSTIYTSNPELISRGGIECNNGLVGEEGLWFEAKNGYLTAPRKQADLQPEWQTGVCKDGQGSHFYYNITEASSCEDWLPYFVLYDQGYLVGTGYATFGVPTVLNRDWYEPYDATQTKDFILTAPSCLEDWFAASNTILLHVFFDVEPWNAVCST